jgi:hypothetical protein
MHKLVSNALTPMASKRFDTRTALTNPVTGTDQRPVQAAETPSDCAFIAAHLTFFSIQSIVMLFGLHSRNTKSLSKVQLTKFRGHGL